MLSVFDEGPAAPCPAPFNLAAYVLRHASEVPDRTALTQLSGAAASDWSYGQLEKAVRGTAAGLLQTGLAPGDLVLMRMGNTVDFPIAYLGCIAAGLVPVPTPAQLTRRETGAIIAGLSPAAVLRDPQLACAPHPRQIGPEALKRMRDLPPADFVMGDPNRLAYAVYTSGTSGRPRAVAHAHRTIWARRMMITGWYDLSPGDRLLHAGAFNWTFTLGTGLMDPWSIGATALIPAPGTPPGDLPELLGRHRVTVFAAAPGVYRKLLQDRTRLSLPALRHGLVAGESLSPRLRRTWRQVTGTALYQAYGMSECSTFVSACPASPARGAAIGRPQAGRRVAILGPDGQPVPRGQPGTIAVHRDDPGLMLGYLNAPREAAARMQGDWFVTGDQGVMAADGQITFLGREDDMMNTGGYRVSPIEVESALTEHPGITSAGVAEVRVGPDTGIIAAFYTGPEKLDENALRAYVDARLARYKQPRAFVHLPDLPAGSNGKLLRRALPAYFEARKT